MSRRLWIAAKAPRPGLAKTRLARTLGDAAALDLYRAFLRDLAARFAGAPFPLGWYVTPADAWDDLAPLVAAGPPRLPGAPPSVLEQGDGDWTVRQRRLLRGAAERDEERVVLIGSDSPHVRVETVEAAFDQLERRDVVLGPVLDGGYYLIGMRGWHDVLDGVVMSTSSVYKNILTRCQALGCSVGLVETLFDVDQADELGHLLALLPRRDDLSATRAALERHGLRPEQGWHGTVSWPAAERGAATGGEGLGPDEAWDRSPRPDGSRDGRSRGPAGPAAAPAAGAVAP
jgi:rSAM/selenodomain-associated transferase 1